ncbi:MAG: VOC family protein [Melioribacteraceae bacterium]|nr:VOC family protein [Melioribacteraceae bacterium]MCF8353590.1 VOC family protein [Melioribacteraceae bacterium]MCF8393513.1 VOC family protein [Melioribacteraceae bacterium]MCF8419323.1 VOC family protein [Melioribacteraceae bacterium]
MSSEIKMRVARPTNNLRQVLRMYKDGLGFEILGSFENHSGFDGVMLGIPGESYHLEFTSKSGHEAGRAPTEDNLLVFYFPGIDDWNSRCLRMMEAGFKEVKSFNPYWDVKGKTFEDPDGYRVVIQNTDWNT